jgi:hypothetical protein
LAKGQKFTRKEKKMKQTNLGWEVLSILPDRKGEKDEK